jgi:Caspase domain
MSFEQGLALLIGVGEYVDPGLPDVPVTVGDATALRDALLAPDVAGYLQDRVVLLESRHATRAGIFGALATLAETAKPNDTVVVFFAGHGLMGDDDRYHLAAHDTRVTRGSLVIQETGVGQGALLEALRAINAEKLLVVLNACFSGNVAASLGTDEALKRLKAPQLVGRAPTEEFRENLLATGEGRVVITACRSDQRSSFNQGSSRTYFGQALSEAFSAEGIAGRTGVIGVFRLYEWVYERAKELAAQIDKSQDAVINVVEGIGPFPVALGRVRGLAPDEAEIEPIPQRSDVHVVSRDTVDALASVRDAPRGLPRDWQLELAEEAPDRFTLFLHTATGQIHTIDVQRSAAGARPVRLDGVQVGRFRDLLPVQFDIIDAAQSRHRVVLYSTSQRSERIAPINMRINGEVVFRHGVPLVPVLTDRDSSPSGNPEFS